VEGGIFDFMTRELKIRCLPTQIPNEFILDVSGMHIGHSIKVEDMEVGENIKIMSDSSTVICAVAARGAVEEEIEEVEEELAEGEEAPAEDAEEKPEETGDKEKE
jgi:large subunit ribosomal protein L25